MHCVICLNRSRIYNVFDCGHIACPVCTSKLACQNKKRRCYVCREPTTITIRLSESSIVKLLYDDDDGNHTDDEVNNYINIFSLVNESSEHERQYKLLFTDEYILQYETALVGYLNKWGKLAPDTYEFSPVCAICQKFGVKNNERGNESTTTTTKSSLNRSLLCNLYYNTVPCTIYSVLDAAVVSLLSIDGLRVEDVSPKDVAYHYFQNNCVVFANETDNCSDLLRSMQHDYLFHENPYKKLFTAIISNKLKVLDVKNRICPCNKTKDDIKDLLSGKTADSSHDNNSTEVENSEGFLFPDGLTTRFSMETDDFSNKHDDRLDLLRKITSPLRRYIDNDIIASGGFTLDDDDDYDEDEEDEGEDTATGLLVSSNNLIPTNLYDESEYILDNMPEDSSDSCMADDNNNEYDDEAEEILGELNPREERMAAREAELLLNGVGEDTNGDDKKTTMPLEHIVPLSVFSTCEICLAQTKFSNYGLMMALTANDTDRDSLFKGSDLNTVTSINLRKQASNIEKYIEKTYDPESEKLTIDDSFRLRVENKFFRHLTGCYYARLKFIPIKMLFKSLTQLKNIDFSNHTFFKLFDGHNKLLCSKTFLCSFVQEKCSSSKRMHMINSNPQILKFIHNSQIAHHR